MSQSTGAALKVAVSHRPYEECLATAAKWAAIQRAATIASLAGGLVGGMALYSTAKLIWPPAEIALRAVRQPASAAQAEAMAWLQSQVGGKVRLPRGAWVGRSVLAAIAGTCAGGIAGGAWSIMPHRAWLAAHPAVSSAEMVAATRAARPKARYYVSDALSVAQDEIRTIDVHTDEAKPIER